MNKQTSERAQTFDQIKPQRFVQLKQLKLTQTDVKVGWIQKRMKERMHDSSCSVFASSSCQITGLNRILRFRHLLWREGKITKEKVDQELNDHSKLLRAQNCQFISGWPSTSLKLHSKKTVLFRWYFLYLATGRNLWMVVLRDLIIS